MVTMNEDIISKVSEKNNHKRESELEDDDAADDQWELQTYSQPIRQVNKLIWKYACKREDREAIFEPNRTKILVLLDFSPKDFTLT